jgi:Ni,Fe-hydrogenase III small subunit
MEMSPFSAPFFWGTQKREAAAPKPSVCFSGGAQEIFGGVFEDFLGGNGKVEGAKVPGAGIWPEAVAQKNER